MLEYCGTQTVASGKEVLLLEVWKMKTVFEKNGSAVVPIWIFECAECNQEIRESDPHEIIENRIYCGNCAFLTGKISESEYIKHHLFFIDVDGLRAVVHDGKIHIAFGKFPWEHTSRDRNCKEYTDWRNNVFERDGYTCQRCNTRGGSLNAHHIKPYAKFPHLRYEVENGITLCEKCHKYIHKEKINLSVEGRENKWQREECLQKQ